MFPDSNDIKRDQVLTQLAIDYKNAAFISEQIMPVVRVNEYSGLFYEFTRDHMAVADSVRSVGSEAKQVGFGIKESTYGPLIDHALKTLIPRRKLKLYSKIFDAFERSTNNLKNKLQLGREVALANFMNTGSNMNNKVTLTSGDKWSALSTSDPLDDVRTAKAEVRNDTGIIANALIMGYDVFDLLTVHPKLIEYVKYAEGGILTMNQLKALFNVEKIIVGGSRQVNSAEGQAETTADIWGDSVFVGYVPDRVGPEEIVFGATLMLNDGDYAKRWWDEDRDSWKVEVGETYQQKVVANDLMYAIYDTI